MKTAVAHTKKVRTGSKRFLTTELVYYSIKPVKEEYESDTHGTEVEEKQDHNGKQVQDGDGPAVLAME